MRKNFCAFEGKKYDSWQKWEISRSNYKHRIKLDFNYFLSGFWNENFTTTYFQSNFKVTDFIKIYSFTKITTYINIKH